MRDLHQLGSSYFVFPSANHNRFEHSLGTGHLCREYFNSLNLHSDSNRESLLKYERSVVVAGLCHNIGHGPYSYPFTDFVHEFLHDTTWDSLSSSLMLLENIIDTNCIDIQKEEVNLIKDIITGESKFSNIKDNWVLQILNNKTNGIDIDKLDFIQRDTYKLGCPNESFDGGILINHARIINNEICFREKDAFSIYELFNCRYRLFKEFYLHRVSKGIDLMIKDMFSEANSYYDFNSHLYDPLKFVQLKDSILNDILHSDSEELHFAKDIVKRIYTRDLYKFVGEKTCIMSSSNYYDKFLNLTEEDIINCNTTDTQGLQRGDIRILKCQLDFGKGDEDPIDYVNFYTHDKNVKKLNRDEISLLLPSNFKEFVIRVYVTDSSKLTSAKNAFSKFCSEKTGESLNHHEKSGNKKNIFN